MINCTIGDIGIDDFSGFDIDLFALIAASAGEKDYEFVCLGWDDMFAAVLNDTYSLGVAGITINAARIKAGYRFSQPTYNSAVRMMGLAIDQSDIWSCSQGFEMLLWVSILLTTLANGLLIWFLEEENLLGRRIKDHLLNIEEMIWQSLLSLVFASEIRLKTFAAKVVQAAFLFLIYVLVAFYTANIITQLSSQETKMMFSSIAEFKAKGYVLGIPADYLQFVSKYNFRVIEVVADIDDEAMILNDMFSNRSIQAYSSDGPEIGFLQNNYCNLTVLNIDLLNISYGYMYSPDTNDTTIENYNNAILSIQEKQQNIRTLEQKYIYRKAVTCDPYSPKISVSNLAGLWIILAFALGLAIISHIISKRRWFIAKFRKCFKKKNKIVSIEYANAKNAKRSNSELMRQESEETFERKTPYIFREDFIETHSVDILPVIEKDLKRSVKKAQRNIEKQLRRLNNLIYLTKKKEKEKKYEDSTNADEENISFSELYMARMGEGTRYRGNDQSKLSVTTNIDENSHIK